MKKNKIGKLVLGHKPRIALVVTDLIDDGVIAAAVSDGADILELRMDLFKDRTPQALILTIARMRKKSKLPLLATVRSKQEGSKANICPEKRLELFKTVIPLVDAIDIELSSSKILPKVVALAKHWKKTIIISYHNYTGTPKFKVLSKIIKKSESAGADIIKLAAFAKTARDIDIMAAVTIMYKRHNLITISMGKKGFLSRVFFPCLGSLLTYAVPAKVFIAPGQKSLKELSKDLKRFYR